MKPKPNILIVGVVLLGIAAGIAILLFSRKTELQLPEIPIPSATPVVTLAPQATKGAIEGSLSYPSETIPTQMQICAETLENELVECTTEHIQVTSPQGTALGYRLEVDPGEYFVYAYLPDNPKQKAYYSDFVICGLLASCPSHEPIAVSVEAGEIVSGINPHDWYVITP